MIKILKFTSQDIKHYRLAYGIRIAVFVTEQRVSRELESEYEEESTHYLLFHNDVAVSTARLRETDHGIKLERFATIKYYRNKKLGKAILKRMIEDVKPFKKSIYLHTQINAVDFYKKNGFVIKGDSFLESGIEHYLMEFQDPI